jgi:GNAT superfamily N-acetyltransferase
MRMVNNDILFWPFILRLRNEMRNSFLTTEKIPEQDHNKFMDEWGNDYYVCVNDALQPVGWIGVVNNDIRLAVDKQYQRMGIAKFMLKFVKDKYPQATAKILPENIASIKAFKSVGIKAEIIKNVQSS